MSSDPRLISDTLSGRIVKREKENKMILVMVRISLKRKKRQLWTYFLEDRLYYSVQ